MIGEWKDAMVARAAEWGLPPSGDWKCLFFNNYDPPPLRFNIMWFHEQDRFPRAVTKVSWEESALVREFESLRTVHSLAESYVPRPLCLEKVDDFWMLWTAGVPGLRISPRSSYRAPVLQSMVDMLASIHHSLARPPGDARADRHERMVRKPLAALMEWGTSKEVQAGCRMLEGVSSAAWLHQLPVVPQHGDLFLDNVLRDRDRYRYYVVDWETFGKIDLPFYDLLTLMISILRASGETLERVDKDLARQVPLLLERYARRLELPVSLLPTLVPLTMANWFYLHWLAGRQPIMKNMYASIDRYFRNKDAWDRIFVKR